MKPSFISEVTKDLQGKNFYSFFSLSKHNDDEKIVLGKKDFNTTFNQISDEHFETTSLKKRDEKSIEKKDGSLVPN